MGPAIGATCASSVSQGSRASSCSGGFDDLDAIGAFDDGTGRYERVVEFGWGAL
jgi:hypothetical protein